MRQHSKVLTDGQNVCADRSRRVSSPERAPDGDAAYGRDGPHTDHWTAVLGRYLQPVTSSVAETPW